MNKNDGLCGICQRRATEPWPFDVPSRIGSFLCEDCRVATHDLGMTTARSIIAYSDGEKRDRGEIKQ